VGSVNCHGGSHLKQKRMSAEEFVRRWQSADSLQEVLAAHGGTRSNVSMRATIMRRKGVPLKRFSKGSGVGEEIDWPALRKLAESLGKKK